jgi:hypothetical protein
MHSSSSTCVLHALFISQIRDHLWHFATKLFLRWVVCPTPNPPSWRITRCRLSVTAYSIYSQLPSIPGGRLLHPQPEDAPCRGDKGPTQSEILAASFNNQLPPSKRHRRQPMQFSRLDSLQTGSYATPWWLLWELCGTATPRRHVVDRCKCKRGNWIKRRSTVLLIHINYTWAHAVSRVAETGPSCVQLFWQHVWEMGPTKHEIPDSHGASDEDVLSSGTRAPVGIVNFCWFCVICLSTFNFFCYLCTVNNK